MPGGRPSKYDPIFCEVVIDYMKQGFSKLAAAGEIGVCYNTLRAWMDEHPEFLQAVKLGEAVRTCKLERDLMDAGSGPKVTSRIFALKNAAPDEWRDKHHSEVSGPNGGPHQHKVAHGLDVDLSALTDEELMTLQSLQSKALDAARRKPRSDRD